MKILVYGLAIFAAAFIIHLAAWKVYLPRRQVRAMLQIFFITLAAGLWAINSSLLSLNIVSVPPPDNIWQYLHIALMFTALTLAYMITYSALEADSPSLVMIMTINNAEPEGLEKDKFVQLMSDDTLVMPRIRDVLLDKMVYINNERYCLTPKGRLMAYLFMFFRRLIRAPEGG